MNGSLDTALAVRAKFFRGLADRSRLALLLALRSGEKTVSQLCEETGLSRTNVSSHLACLKDCGLVLSRHEWRHIYYRLVDAKISMLLSASEELVAEHAQRIAHCVNYALDHGREAGTGK